MKIKLDAFYVNLDIISKKEIQNAQNALKELIQIIMALLHA